MKARAVKLMAGDYTTDHVRAPARLYSGCRYEENFSPELIEKLSKQNGEFNGKRYIPDTPLHPNEYLVLRNGKKSVLAAFMQGNIENVTQAEGTKIVLTGDINQIDHPYLGIRCNGLSPLIDKMQGQMLYAHIDLKKGECSELADLASDIL